eukprot:6204860-Pleurochrysis_carterae.AAC.1
MKVVDGPLAAAPKPNFKGEGLALQPAMRTWAATPRCAEMRLRPEPTQNMSHASRCVNVRNSSQNACCNQLSLV